MKAFVTGATGFVGQHLVNRLLELGYEVAILVRDRSKFRADWKDSSALTVIEKDMNTLIAGGELGSEYDVIYHFAWAGTSGQLRANEGVQLENIENTCALVRMAAEAKVKRFVFAGSIMEYEAQKFVGGDGKRPSGAVLYSVAKLSADYMAKTLCASRGIEYVNLLISNIYGVGERSARFLNTMLGKMGRGERCDLSAGLQLYDFIYIDDAVRAIELAGSKGRDGGEYYIGNPAQRPLREFVEEMNAIVNKGSQLNFGAISSGGNFLNYKEFNTSALYNELGFTAEISFADGVKRTYDWLEGREE